MTYLFRGHNYCQNLILPIILLSQQKMFSVFRLFLYDKIIIWPWAMNLNMGHTFVDHYILWINSEYGLFFCLPEIDNSKI